VPGDGSERARGKARKRSGKCGGGAGSPNGVARGGLKCVWGGPRPSPGRGKAASFGGSYPNPAVGAISLCAGVSLLPPSWPRSAARSTSRSTSRSTWGDEGGAPLTPDRRKAHKRCKPSRRARPRRGAWRGGGERCPSPLAARGVIGTVGTVLLREAAAGHWPVTVEWGNSSSPRVVSMVDGVACPVADKKGQRRRRGRANTSSPGCGAPATIEMS
jgi:hypothetical protein